MLSACIVTYNSADEVSGALASLINSRLNETPGIFVVDNVSKDETVRLIKTQFPTVALIENSENVGFGRANNAVLQRLESTYHLMLNPDITFNETVLQKMLDYMQAHPDIAILTPRVLNPDGTEQFLPKRQPSVHYMIAGSFEKFGRPFTTWRKAYTGQNMDLQKPTEVDFATGCFLLIRTAVFKKIGGFDERFFMYLEDTDLSRRAHKEGKIIYHPAFTVVHNWKRDSFRNKKAQRQHLKSMVLFMRKWGLKL